MVVAARTWLNCSGCATIKLSEMGAIWLRRELQNRSVHVEQVAQSRKT